MQSNTYNHELKLLQQQERDLLLQIQEQFKIKRETLRKTYDVDALEQACFKKFLLDAVDVFKADIHLLKDHDHKTHLTKSHREGACYGDVDYPQGKYQNYLLVEHMPKSGRVLAKLKGNFFYYSSNEGGHQYNPNNFYCDFALELFKADDDTGNINNEGDIFGLALHGKPRKYIPKLHQIEVSALENGQYASLATLRKRMIEELDNWKEQIQLGYLPDPVNQYDPSDQGGWGKTIFPELI